MRFLIAVCMLWLAGAASADSGDYKVVCYFGSWAPYRIENGKYDVSNIDPTLCTHLMYAFVGITEEGEVDIMDEWVDLAQNGGDNGFVKFLALKELNPDAKVMFANGGWNQGSAEFSKVVGDETLRAKYVQSIVNFTLEYGYDGFDVDWEYPNQRNGSSPADVENFVLFLKELRAAFDENDLILSAAVGAGITTATLSYDIPSVSEYLHFINFMSYDYHSATESLTAHNAPLYSAERETTELDRGLNIDTTVRYWLDQGAAPEKLVLGIGFYGKTFTLSDPDQYLPGSPASEAGDAGTISQQAGVLFYYEICERLQNESWTGAWDEEQRVPYAYLDDQWISYDDVRSIGEKVDYLKQLGLGGAMVWAIDEDDFLGLCGPAYPLLNAINDRLRKCD